MKTLLFKTIPLLFLVIWPVLLQSQTITTTVRSSIYCPGQIIVPLDVTNCNGISAISLKLNYNSSILSYTGYQNANGALAPDPLVINAAGNSVIIAWASSTPANIGNSTLVELMFTAVAGTGNLNWDTQTAGNCEYSNSNGNVLPANFINGNAPINQAPLIVLQPLNSTVRVGLNASFSLSASGIGLAYLWQISTNGGSVWNDLANDATYSGVTTSTLSLANVLLNYNNYKYRCWVTGTCSPPVYSNVASLTVTDPIITTIPNLDFCPGSITVPILVSHFNSVASFSLTFNYNSSLLTYIGYQDLNENLSGGTLVSNASGGKVYLTWYSTTSVSISSDTLVEILFNSISGNTALTWDTPTIGNCEYSGLNGNPIPAVFNNGGVSVYYLPAMVSHPSNKIIAKGQNTSFDITAMGSGLSYIWQISTDGGGTWANLTNGGSFWNVTTPNLSITNAQLSLNGYKFRCKVSGLCLPVVYTNSALLSVLPNIITTCQSISTCPGEILVPVKVSDFIGVGAFSMALCINPATLIFAGCQSLNPALNSGVFSANAIGGTVYLSYYNTSQATLPNEAVVLELKFIAITGSSSLNWNSQTPGYCEYSDVGGQIIFSTWINGNAAIFQQPTITTQPNNSTIFSGGSTNFSISATGTNLNYLWQVSSDGGNTWTDLNNVIPYSGVSTPTLTINPTDLSINTFKYRSKVTGTCSPVSYSNSAILTVTPAAIRTSIANISNSCTGNLIVPITVTNCNNVGAISLTLNYDPAKLTYDGYQSANSELSQGLLVVNMSQTQVRLTWMSTIPANISSGILIQYRFKALSGINTNLIWDTQTPGNCEFSNVSGIGLTSLYANATVNVLANALIVNAGNDAAIPPGGSIQINGSANGGTSPYTYMWFPSTWLNNPSLANPVASPPITTTYKLTITDHNGCSGSDMMQITVSSNLPTVTTTAISGITYTSAIGGGNITGDGGAPVTARGICWSTIGTPTIYDNHSSDGNGLGEFTSQMTGLINGTTYFVRAYASNSAGTSYGPELNFSTISLSANQAPTINPVNNPSPIPEDSGINTVNLTGISDGDNEVVQNISISATSSNVNIIPNPVVNYIPNSSTGNLMYSSAANAYGTVTITITVLDDGGTSYGGVNTTIISFIVVILPVNDAPVSNAGPNQSIPSAQLATLDGSGSFDIDGDPLSFRWHSPEGIILSDSSAVHPTFTVPGACISNNYSFVLVVNDGNLNSLPDNVVITATPMPPDIAVLPANLSENLVSGSSATRTIKLFNQGLCNLSFSISTTSQWITIIPASGLLIPGDSLSLHVYLSAVNLFAGFYSTEIAITSNDPDEPFLHIPVTLLVTGDPQMMLNPTTLNFGTLFVGQNLTQTIIVSNTGTDSLHVFNVSSDKPQYSVNKSAFIVPPQSSTNLLITFHPTSVGQVTAIINVYSDNPGQSNVHVQVNGMGLAPPVISVSPPSLNTTLYQNQISLKQLTVHNTGGNTLTFYVIENASWLSLSPISGSVSPGNSITLSVLFSSSTLSPGIYSTNIIINSNDPFNPAVSIPATLNILMPLSVLASSSPSDICIGGSTQLNVIPNGGSGNYTYSWTSNPAGFTSIIKSPTVTPSVTTSYTVSVSDGNETVSSSVLVIVWETEVPAMVSNMLPANNSFNLDFPILFSWAPALNATSYDLFIWNHNEPQPIFPIASNLTQINYLFQGGSFNYGDTCNWQIVAKNPCLQTPSNIYTFSLSELSDLIVSNIQVPASPSSGQPIELSWSVFNQGNNGTQNFSWIDAIYLSQDNILNTEVDIYLGGKTNLTSLPANSGYNQTQPVILPEAMFGAYFIIVKADYANQLPEMIENNNTTAQSIDIALTPPPDLVVDSIGGVPAIAFSGQSINVQWRTKNNGTGAVLNKNWVDKIYLSQQPVFNPQTSILLGQSYSNNRKLLPGSNYIGSNQLALPIHISGNYYIYIYTDANNNVYEHANESNNLFRSELFEIVLNPPPDLIVAAIQNPLNSSNKEQISINWTIKNNGAGATDNQWHDRLFLCPQPDFNPAISIEIGTKLFNTVLQPGHSLSSSLIVTTPDNTSGLFYVFVVTDFYNEVYEHINESNNILKSNDPLEIKHADLKVCSSNVQDTAWSGQPAMVNWKVVNIGAGTVMNKIITDKLFLSQSKDYPIINPVEIGSLSYSNIISNNDTLLKSKSVTIPDGFDGKYYLFIYTNIDTNVFENQLMDNNHEVDSIFIDLAPYPDLVIDSTSFPNSITLGYPQNIYYRVKNSGDANLFGKVWEDALFASDAPALDTATAVKLINTQINQSLNISGTYSLNLQFTMPIAGFQDLSHGYLHFYTDSKNNIFEQHENNNLGSSSSIPFIVPPKVNLLVNSATTTTDTTKSGQIMNFNYIVKNIGTPTNIWGITQWADGIYLSSDTIWDNNDVMVSQWIINKTLPTNSTYLENKSITVPQGLSGNYYFLVVADHSKLNNDQTYSNNSRSMTGSVPIYIRPTMYPDLSAEEFYCPFNGSTGQPVKFSWKVKNIGNGSTNGNSWTDKIYLSNDFMIGNNDIILGSKAFSGTLNTNEDYSDSIAVSLPVGISGNYIVIFKTDANLNVFETGLGESNNVSYANMNIIQPPPCDLKISGLSFPSTAEIGQTTTIQYEVQNIGTNPAIGSIKDILYFSSDSVWNFTDAKFSINNNYINIAPLMSQSSSSNSEIPGLVPGEYFVVVQTNVLNNIPEGNTENNTGISSTKTTVTIPQLSLGVEKSGILNNSSGRYYEINIPQTYANETMIITLKGDSINGSNELYLCFDSIPTRSKHTYAATEPFKGNQELIVPEMQSGKYYLLVYGNTGSGNSQNIKLLADILPFKIRSINAENGGNTGNVTVLIQGAKFENNMQVKLSNGPYENYYAENISLINTTKLFATFNLNSANLGTYDVVAQKSSILATLLDGFEIEAGSAGNSLIDTTGFECFIENIGFEDQINTNIQHPASTRPNRIVAISIHFQNNGNTDIPAPGRMLVSLTGVPLSYNSNDFTANSKELYIEFEEHNGPPGILRPGAQGTVTVYTKATVIATLQFVLTR